MCILSISIKHSRLHCNSCFSLSLSLTYQPLALTFHSNQNKCSTAYWSWTSVSKRSTVQHAQFTYAGKASAGRTQHRPPPAFRSAAFPCHTLSSRTASLADRHRRAAAAEPQLIFSTTPPYSSTSSLRQGLSISSERSMLRMHAILLY